MTIQQNVSLFECGLNCGFLLVVWSAARRSDLSRGPECVSVTGDTTQLAQRNSWRSASQLASVLVGPSLCRPAEGGTSHKEERGPEEREARQR
ncbi:hypothetical protein E2C01_082719 [Portunus trituberculatus]|uniref:Uncharacterized protein n=1 Tax=Portunus trituberculatus TaxID=210409 RepID=A0A5B7IT25_PORTR|nr:hypothetical protein [Portunus trituberculatus]